MFNIDKSFELNTNNNRPDSNFTFGFNPKSQIVEIFSAITNGEDTAKFGKKVDTLVSHVSALASKAAMGDFSSKAELNTIIRYTLEPQLQSQIQLAGFMGTHKTIGYAEQPMIKTYKHESVRSNIQASQGDVAFATTTWEEYPINTATISSGYAVNYREIASGNLDKVGEGMQQVKIDMYNKIALYTIAKLYTAIKNASGVKYYNENTGLTKTGLDDIIKKVRRFGRPSLNGDYSIISQLNTFLGFKADVTDVKNTFLSESVMNEIRQTGLLSTYYGNPVVETPNQYNLTKLNTAGDNFKTYLPEGLLFVVPQGEVSPLQTFQRGGLTSMTANDIVSGTELTRFDLEFAADVAKGREYEIGLVRDINFEVELG